MYIHMISLFHYVYSDKKYHWKSVTISYRNYMDPMDKI